MQLSPIIDRTVLKTVKAGFGGRVRFVVSGGAPLGPSVETFLNITLCCPVLQVCNWHPFAASVPLQHSHADYCVVHLLCVMSSIAAETSAGNRPPSTAPCVCVCVCVCVFPQTFTLVCFCTEYASAGCANIHVSRLSQSCHVMQ